MKNSAVLLIDCPDRKGLVARVSGLLYERGANILHADQHIDHELGPRAGLDAPNRDLNLPPFSEFDGIANEVLK